MNNPLRKRLNWRVLVNVITYTGILTGVTLLVSAVIKWLIVSFFNKRDKTPSQRSANNAGQDMFQIYVPIPWFNNKPLVPQPLAPRITKQASDDVMTDNDKQQQQQEQDDSNIQRAMSEDPSNYMVQYLNHISQAFDFLHKNYMHYRLKNLTQIPAYVLQKRLKVIMIEQKVELAKELLMQDLTDFIEKCNLQILIQKQQIRELRRRLPPRLPFLLKNKYAPYFWILTDLDYTQMNPALRNVLLYNTSNMASRSSMYGGGYTYDRSERFQFTEQDEAELDYFLFINPNTTIPQRYKKLKAVWAQKEGVSHVIESEQRELFAKYCFRLLKKRARLIVKKIRRIRRIDMRNTIRERSKYITELSLCGRLQLRRNVPQQDI